MGPTTSAISLLVGSEPGRAPRAVNEWGYIQERVQGPHAAVFGLRTLTEAESLEAAEVAVSEDRDVQQFGAMCSTVTPAQNNAWVKTIVASSDVSYRRLPELLDALETASDWDRRGIVRPSGAAPGFLTALSRLMLGSIAPAASEGSSLVTYVYRGTAYELTLGQRERVSRRRLGGSTFHDLIRGDFSIRNLRSGRRTQFVITYGSRGALVGVPIEAEYQPHWWLKLELSLDEHIDVPNDPAVDAEVEHQIRRICEKAQSSDGSNTEPDSISGSGDDER
jgi:hypothetical protein